MKKQELIEALWPADEPTPTRELDCRHCGVRNRVQLPDALFDMEACLCGSCDGALFLGPDDALTNISSRAYEHDLDRKALAALKSVPGFGLVVRWWLKNIGERVLRYMYMANFMRCNDEQFPELVDMMHKARRRLDIPYTPELFVGESPFMNAMTMGVEEPLIVVHSSLLDQMSDPEIIGVIGHEFGHLHADHILYKSLADLVIAGGRNMGLVPSLLTMPIRLALLQWSRCAELTCDRAGLLASGDFESSLRVLMTFAGGNRPGIKKRTTPNLGAFVRQARDLAEYEGANVWNSAVSTLLTMDRTHPFTAWRLLHLLTWVETGNYLEIMSGQYLRVKRAA